MRLVNQKLILTCSLFCMLITLTSCPGGEASTLILGNKIKGTVNKLDWALERSIANADYRMEKNLRTIQLMVTNVQSEFDKELKKNRNFVSEEMTKNIDRISTLIDESKGGLLEVEDFLFLDAQTLISQIPFKKDIYSIRKINGYGTTFKEEGLYEYSIIGNAFQPGKNYIVTIDSNVIIPEANIYVSNANQLGFTIPVSILNKKFLELAITRVKLDIKCYEEKADNKPFFNFTGEVLLLPRLPAQYTLYEFFNRPTWSEEKFYKPFSFDLGPTGENGKVDSYRRNVSVDIPETQKFTGKVDQTTNGSHSWFTSRNFTPDLKNYGFVINNQCHDCSRSFFGTLEYVNLINNADVQRRYFESDSKNMGILPYGSHTLTLNEHYQLFELTITFFNGKKVFLNKDRLSDVNSGSSISISKSEDENFRRFTLQIAQN